MHPSDQIILKDYLKKRGNKLGFWQKRFIVLTNTHILIYKNENDQHPYKSIEIVPTSVVECLDGDKPPRFVLHIPNSRRITLANDSPDTIAKWVSEIRNITLQTPNLSMEDFQIISVIGRGYYGKVMLVKKKTSGEFFAIKTVHKKRLVQANKVHTIFTERNVLMKARHPFIVSLCFAFQTDSKVYLGLEYASGGELFFHLQNRGTFPLNVVRLMVAELALALNYLHVLRVIYRDLKPENVLLDSQGHIKLTDFGLSKTLTGFSNITATFCGTSEYVAPEIVNRKPYGPEIDWWALGIFTYELLFGETPFYNENKAKMFQAIRTETPRFPKGADPDVMDFINLLLVKDPQQRGAFDQIKNHPFFKGMSFEDVLAKKYTPPFKPPETKEMVGNFDSEFTMENPLDSLATPMPSVTNAFDGFSYNGPDDLSESDESSENDVPEPEISLNPTTM